jgi:hypothetical protein
MLRFDGMREFLCVAFSEEVMGRRYIESEVKVSKHKEVACLIKRTWTPGALRNRSKQEGSDDVIVVCDALLQFVLERSQMAIDES